MQKNFSWFLMKLDRIAAWTLLTTMVLYFFSGYGMTKGIIPASLAVNLHNKWLPILLLVSFCFHSCYAISVAFKRWRIWNGLTKTLLLSLYALFLLTFVYINSFYHKPVVTSTASNSSTTTSSTANQTQTTNSSTSASTPSTKTFTAAELAKYNGTNGQPSYIAVSGKVYDVSNWFVGGNHHGCQAGADVTAAFKQVHDSSFLQMATVVGVYSG